MKIWLTRIESNNLSHLVNQLDITPHETLQRSIPLLHRLRKRIRHKLRSIRARMRVILREELIRRRISQLLIRLRHGRKMIDVRDPTATPLPNRLRIPYKPRRSIIVHAALPLVIRRLTRHDNLRALRNISLRSVADVLVESVHFLAGLAGSADLVAGAGAVAAAVVVGVVRRAAVIVSKLDDYDVVGFEERSDLGEAAFVRVAAGGAAADGFVDDGGACGEERGDVGAPAWRVVLVGLFLGMFRDSLRGCTIGDTVVGAVLGHGAVASKIDRGIGELEGRSQSGESDSYSHVGGD